MDQQHPFVAALAGSTPMSNLQLKAAILLLYVAFQDAVSSNMDRDIMDHALDEAVRREEMRLQLASQPDASPILLSTLCLARDQHIVTYMTKAASRSTSSPNHSQDAMTPGIMLMWYMAVLFARGEGEASSESE